MDWITKNITNLTLLFYSSTNILSHIVSYRFEILMNRFLENLQLTDDAAFTI